MVQKSLQWNKKAKPIFPLKTAPWSSSRILTIPMSSKIVLKKVVLNWFEPVFSNDVESACRRLSLAGSLIQSFLADSLDAHGLSSTPGRKTVQVILRQETHQSALWAGCLVFAPWAVGSSFINRGVVILNFKNRWKDSNRIEAWSWFYV